MHKGEIFMDKKICYITGCLGFIGSYVTKLALESGYYVRGIDKITYAANTSLLKDFLSYDNFTFEHKDINDIEFLYECDYFINVAAETHVGNSITKSQDFIKSNIDGVYNILEAIKNYRAESACKPILLHFSTDEVYGDIHDGAHTEKDLLKPSNPYSATKAAADMLILAWARTYNIQYVIVRPTNNYGIGQYVEKLIPKTCKYLNLNKKIPVHNNGEPIRNWLHAEDTARAVMKIIEKESVNEIYNIAGGFEQKNIDTIKAILNEYNIEEKDYEKHIDFSLSRPGQDARYALDDNKLKNIGWQPIKEFNKEIKAITNYYKENFIW